MGASGRPETSHDPLCICRRIVEGPSPHQRQTQQDQPKGKAATDLVHERGSCRGLGRRSAPCSAESSTYPALIYVAEGQGRYFLCSKPKKEKWQELWTRGRPNLLKTRKEWVKVPDFQKILCEATPGKGKAEILQAPTLEVILSLCSERMGLSAKA